MKHYILIILYGLLFNFSFLFFILLSKYKNWFPNIRKKIRLFLSKQKDTTILFILIFVITLLFSIAIIIN